MELLDFLFHHRSVLFAEGYFLTFAEFATMHTSDGYTSHVGAEVKRGDEHLGVALYHFRLGYIFDDGVEDGCDVVGRGVIVGAHPTLFCRTVDGGEVELVLGCVEVAHQVKHHLLHLVGAAVGFVHLVDYHYRFQAHLNGLLEHEACLWHRTFKCVNQKQTSVGHVEHAFHLASEVSVPRSVYDVYFISVVVDGDVF